MAHPSDEHRLIEALRPLTNPGSNPHYTVDIGDDAAIRTAGRERLVLTADSQIEGTHFSLECIRLDELGYRAMAVNLSDCAAMGAEPDSALVQVVFPRDLPNTRTAIRALYRGFSRACRRYGFPIVGGDLAGGPCWMIAVTLLGAVAGGATPKLRTGAQAGDGLWVTGRPGESAAGRAALIHWGRAGVPRPYRGLVTRHLAPTPRLPESRELALDRRVHAMIDVSDGISKECHTLAFENRLAIELVSRLLPIDAPMRKLAERLGISPEEWFLHGGEDYELLFAATADWSPPPDSSTRFTRIGRFFEGTHGVRLTDGKQPARRVGKGGWDHTRKALPIPQ